MRGEPPHYTSLSLYVITVRPYYALKSLHKNVNSQHFINLSQMRNDQKHQNAQITKHENA